jgi:dihydroorotase
LTPPEWRSPVDNPKMRLLVLFSLSLTLAAQCPYDLVIANGRVIDPANNRDGRLQVAVKDGKIAKVAAVIASKDCRVLDAAGLVVTPGIIDIHAHVYANNGVVGQLAGDTSLMPDVIAPRFGVTTLADAGTSGWRNFEDFRRRVIDRSQTRVLAFLNIAAKGMSGTNEQDTNDMDAQALAAMAAKHKDVVVGVKTAHFGAPTWFAVDQAVAAGTAANIPVMVDFGRHHPETRPTEKLLLEKLRPGDIYTHLYSGLRDELLPNGKMNPALTAARKRGIVLDCGHGNGSFFWPVAKAAFAEKLYPDVISTDLHLRSWMMGMKDMNNVMSKFLSNGMSLPEVIRASTSAAAKAIRRPELGTLTEGAEADIAILRIETGRFGYLDSRMQRVWGTQRLTTEATIRAGKVIYDLNGLASVEWTPAVKPVTRLP